MKNIKSYELYNESLKDKMVGKSDEELIKSLNNLSDTDKIKAIIKYKLPYDLLPDNLTINGDLLCRNNHLTSLPDNLTVNGDLDCDNNLLIKLPNNLTVHGSLHCSYNKLTSLPDNLIVGGNLSCYNNELTSLPDNLIVGGFLSCRDSPLSKNIEKPKGVKGEFYL